MNILLINSNTRKTPWPIIPIGLCYIATYAKNLNHNVRLLDLTFIAPEKIQTDLIQLLQSFNPELIGISVRNIDNNTWSSPMFYPQKIKDTIISICKKHSNAEIIVGGASAGINSNELLDFFDINFIIQGDGEYAFRDFLNAYCSKKDFSSVKGLVYRKNGNVLDNGYHYVKNLDELEFPKVYNWVNVNKYESLNGTIGIQTKRGCSLNCSYCAYPAIEGTTYRLRSPANIVDEMEQIINDYNPEVIEFIDSTFNVPCNHAIEICDEIIRRKIKTPLRAMSITPLKVTKEMFSKMKKANFFDFDINVENVNDNMLKALGKAYRKKDIIDTVNYTKELNIPAMWFFLFGAPGETIETVKENFDFIDKYIPKNHLVVVASGIRINSKTRLMQLSIDEGKFQSNHNFLHPVFYENNSLPNEQLFEFVEKNVKDRPNCTLIKEESYRPDWMIKLVKGFYSVLRIKQPIWQLEIKLKQVNRYLKNLLK